MNKLLLLAVTGLISLTIQSLGATFPPKAIVKQTYNDSTIKGTALSNPKDAFKNLFETDNSEGINITKLNPKAVSFVQDYVEDHSDRLNRMKGWGKP
jgi:membrane-bound lytic murein transglycosylase D